MITDYTNPSPPAGTRPLAQHEVTPEMTAWAIEVDHDPAHVPMHHYALREFGGKTYLAWVSWHTQQGATGRTGHFWGVSLFEVVDASLLPSPTIVSQFVEGVDISHHSGKVDWAKLKEQGIQFAYLKATEGAVFVDPMFAEYSAGARVQGILVGAYHFFRPTVSVTAQGERFLSMVQVGMDLPHVVDVETRDGVAAHDVALRAEAFCDYVESITNKRPIIYTSPGFWPGDDPAESRLWVANWGVKSPIMPHGWRNWTFWQYAGNVSMPGVEGKVDRDRFNGSTEDLRNALQV